jgi:hypothetical protein
MHTIISYYKHRQHKLLNLGLDQITKFVYRLDGPLGEGYV